MCCKSKWLRSYPANGEFLLTCQNIDDNSTLTVTIGTATLVSVTWYKDTGSGWVEISGETMLNITVTEEADYLALVITDQGSKTLETSAPCVNTSGAWQTPSGDDWITPGGDSWEWN